MSAGAIFEICIFFSVKFFLFYLTDEKGTVREWGGVRGEGGGARRRKGTDNREWLVRE